MTKLITLADIQTLKPISANVNEVKQLNTYILEAQEFDLRPFLGDEFYLALVAVVLGSQLFLTGFLAELVSRNSPDRNHYLIADKIRINN